MGQLGTLLWKDFLWCRRHPIKTLFFYLLPLLFCCFFFITLALAEPRVGACDFETFALAPSHPIFVLSSLMCDRGKGCANAQTGYKPFYGIFDGFAERFKENKTSLACPGVEKGKSMGLAMKSQQACKLDENEGYGDYSHADLVHVGTVMYYPKNAGTDAVMKLMAESVDSALEPFQQAKQDQGKQKGEQNAMGSLLMEWMMSVNCFVPLSSRIEGFEDRQKALDFAAKIDLSKGAPWAIVEMNRTGSDFEYKIISHHGYRNSHSSIVLQSLMESAIIEYLTGSKPDVHLEMKRMPKRCRKNEAVLNGANTNIGMVVTLGFIVLAQSLASEICYEKSTGLLDFLMIAGIAKSTVKLSWFIFGLLFCLTVSLLSILFFYFASPVMLDKTPLLLLILFALLYGLAIFLLCYAVAYVMPSAQKASVAMLVVLFVSYLVPRWAVLVQYVGYTGVKAMMVRVLSFFFPPIAVQIGYTYVFMSEQDAVPVTWNRLFKSPDPDDQVNGLGEIMVIMILHSVFYFLLGTDFFSQIKAMLGKLCSPRNTKIHKLSKEEQMGMPQPDIEPSDAKNTPGIAIENLVKTYGSKAAVNNLTVTFYKNQITAFLGHNGAGKSTTMNIMTGMIEPTTGTIAIDGKNIATNMESVRKTLGFCPQHDVVYPDLTVAEHMKFYADLRGLPRDEVEKYATRIFSEMKMNGEKEQKTLSKDLSGGMRRKLSMAIAFLGEPGTVVLDEPTSAVDPFSRRAIWDVILRYRSKSTLLISTHYMQEADLLGDQIAVIDGGQLKCFGSPMYLKSKFGSGSFIKMAHEVPIQAEDLEKKLQETMPVSLCGKSTTETSYSVPLSSVRSPEMVEVLKYLEDEKDKWGIVSFGLSESTMEQVFFNVTSEAKASGAQGVIPEKTDFANHPLLTMKKTNATGGSLGLSQAIATWIKRWDLIKRSKPAIVFQLLLPLTFSILMFFLTKLMDSYAAPTDSMLMHPWQFELHEDYEDYVNQTFIGYKGPDDFFLDSLINYGFGTKCLNSSEFKDMCVSQVDPLGSLTEPKPEKDCDCNVCPNDAVDPKASESIIASNDWILNLQKRNLTSYLMKSNEDGILGAIEDGGSIATPDVSTIPPDMNSTFSQITAASKVVTLWPYIDPYRNENRAFTLYLIDLKIAFLNAFNNVFLRSLASSSSASYGITMHSEEKELANSVTKDSPGGIILGMFTAFALMMPIFGVLLVIVNENSSGMKQLQVTMGLKKWVYWLANFVWDYALYIVSVFIMVLFMLCFPSTFDQDMGAFILLGLFYGLGMITLGYWLSFVFKTARNCITAMACIAPLLSLAAFILIMFSSEDWYEDVNNRLLIFPPYFITEAIIVLDFNSKLPMPKDVYSWKMLGKRFVAQVVWIIFMIVLIILCELEIFSKLAGSCKGKCCSSGMADLEEPNGKDEDVANEETLVLTGPENEVNSANILLAKKLVKYFPQIKRYAVGGVSFGVRRGECFGLLGTNGAGKSTLFKMLTGFHKPTSGDATIAGHSLLHEASAVRGHIGYCPQDDVLFEKLTPKEHLGLFARIRGVPSPQRQDMVEMLIDEVGLGPHRTKGSAQMSGGNKRKLNFAISILDFPEIIFLDEMTTGLDPEARRATWNVLMLAMQKGSASVITSHSLEECEALCNRLVVMVNGHFRCMGGVQYLKDKFGNKYNVKLRLSTEGEPQALYDKTATKFDDTELVEQHVGFLEISIPASNLKLSHLFETIQELKSEFAIEEFSVSQTTLEHVFVNMAKDQS